MSTAERFPGLFSFPTSAEPRPLIVAVCGSPAAGKTTVAAAIAAELGLLLLTRDELAAGLRLSRAAHSEATAGLQASEVVMTEGAASRRRSRPGQDDVRGQAETLLVETSCRFARRGMSLVVENSVLSRPLIDGLLAARARILAVHVIADPTVIHQRLRDRAGHGRPVGGIHPGDLTLLDQFERGEMQPSIFEPPAAAHHVVRIDTSTGGKPDISPVLDFL
ncbi:AAA family ATPase [Actinoplanes sp. HUAS TT8]|uniref:AAA family ATPase n=1 Tax=Actinoplanes sp. HUAS TT8 TaxID=3447453 RepID=UPI003F526658